jgi:glycosyltransferase involved in cell wall biosynthesis
LFVTNAWRTADQPWRGIFVARQRDGLVETGVQVDVLPIDGSVRRSDYLRAAGRLLRMNLRSPAYDVVHAHSGHCGVIAVLQLRSPVVMSYMGYDLDGDWEGPPTVRTRAATSVFRQLSLVLGATIAKSARGRARLPRPALARNYLLPNGVDLRTFAPIAREEARRQLGWAHERPVVLFAADPTRYTKRFELAAAAVEVARQSYPELELATADRVPPSQMPVLMNAADALLLTSRTEGSPNAVKEAMACTMPIVSVDVGDVREIVAGTRHCHVCPADAPALADALCAVVAALPERSDGRSRIKHLALERTSRRLVEIYVHASERGPGPFGFLRREAFPGASRLTSKG